jgi:hypothetical protein
LLGPLPCLSVCRALPTNLATFIARNHCWNTFYNNVNRDQCNKDLGSHYCNSDLEYHSRPWYHSFTFRSLCCLAGVHAPCGVKITFDTRVYSKVSTLPISLRQGVVSPLTQSPNRVTTRWWMRPPDTLHSAVSKFRMQHEYAPWCCNDGLT